MEVDLDTLRAWIGKNCDTCGQVGDPLWIDVVCPVARAIVWGGEPYNEEDAALILARVRLGRCAAWVRREEET